MLVLSTNLIIHKCIDLGSINFSSTHTSDSIKSEFTYCSSSLARALVIGPILTSLGLSCAAKSSSGKDGKGLGMSSSGVLRKIGATGPSAPFSPDDPARQTIRRSGARRSGASVFAVFPLLFQFLFSALVSRGFSDCVDFRRHTKLSTSTTSSHRSHLHPSSASSSSSSTLEV